MVYCYTDASTTTTWKGFMMQTMTRNQFQATISRLIGAKFITILTCTEKKMNKTANPFHGRIRSLSRVQVCVNHNYEAGAQRNLAKRVNKERAENNERLLTGDELEAAVNELYNRGATWNRPIMDDRGRFTPFCEGTSSNTEGQVYFRARQLNSLGTTYIATDEIDGTNYKPGDEVPFAAIEPFVPAFRPNKYDVEARTYKLNSIRACNMNGTKISITPADRQETECEAVLRKIAERVGELPDPDVKE